MRQEIIDKISAQALQEISRARIFKQGKTTNWRLNEEMYYARKIKNLESRANVQLSRMQEFVHTLWSKVDNPLQFKYLKQKNSQTKRVDRLNAIRDRDRKIDHWDMKDLVGKKQGIIYGRSINHYFADSIRKRYRPHLENVDVYDFLVDPACGGLDLEEASNLGSYSVMLNKKQLFDGKKEGYFRKKVVERLLEGPGNADESTQEETNKQPRSDDQRTIGQKRTESKDIFKFWRWYTTFEGDRVYVLMNNSGDVVRCEYLPDILPTTDDYPDGMWPFWSYAVFPDLTEFWTPSYCDYVREIFMAQDVTVNQALDNAEAINKPQKLVNVTAIENLAELKYRRDGVIKIKGEYDVAKAYQTVAPPSIDTPLKLFTLLEGIQSKASGITDGAKGVEDVDGKVGIVEANQAAAADRYGLLDKSYSFGYERFGQLHQLGVRDNLLRPESIELLGPNGIELVTVKRGDIFKKGDAFNVTTEASNAEMLASESKKKVKDAFLLSCTKDPVVNQKFVREKRAEIAGFAKEEIDQLLDISAFGDSALMSDADADIEAILLGEEIRPNRKANLAYKQRFVDYMGDHSRDLSTEEWDRLEAYLLACEEVILKNEARGVVMAENAVPPNPMIAPPAPVPGMPAAPIMNQ